MDPRKPGTPPHHWREDDACGKCVEWDLLWVSPNDVGVGKTTVVPVQAASEPRLFVRDIAVLLLF